MEVLLANINHLESVSVLFDRYRIFYNQPSNLEAAKEFLKERFNNNDCKQTQSFRASCWYRWRSQSSKIIQVATTTTTVGVENLLVG